MKSSKLNRKRKVHAIDQQKSQNSQTKTIKLNKLGKSNISYATDHHVNAHAFFSPRTTLSQGRGK